MHGEARRGGRRHDRPLLVRARARHARRSTTPSAPPAGPASTAGSPRRSSPGAPMSSRTISARSSFHYADAGTDCPKRSSTRARAGQQALDRLADEEPRPSSSSAASICSPSRTGRGAICSSGWRRHAVGRATSPAHRPPFAEAGELARTLGDAERLARAAVGNFRGHVIANPGWHEPAIALLEEALGAASPRRHRSSALGVLAALSLELYFTPQQKRGHHRSAPEAIDDGPASRR